jgi:hypothetical protein
MAISGSNPQPAVALPSDDVAYRCNLTMTTPDPEYPVENLLDPDPANLTKSTADDTDITFEAIDVLGAPMAVTPVAVAIFNTNADAGLFDGTIPIVIPNHDPDGQRVHAWVNLAGLVPTPQTTFTIHLQRSGGGTSQPVWVGRIALVTALQPLNLRYGLKLGRNRPGDIQITTRLGTVLTNPAGIRTRWAEGEVGLLEDQTLMDALEANAQGIQLPFLFIPDEEQNSAWWVRFRANDYSVTYPDLDGRTIPFRVDELSNGPVDG